MTQTIAEFVGTALVAKVLVDALVEIHGEVRISRRALINLVPQLVEILVVALLISSSPHAAVVIAMVLRTALLARFRLLAVINHKFLEFLFLLILWRLWDRPDSLVAVLQAALVSVWLWSVAQKFYHRQFYDGSFLFIFFHQASMRLRNEPCFGVVDQRRLRDARIKSRLALAAEALVPTAALAVSGTILAPALMLVLSLVVGIVSMALNFMVTNVLLTALFLVPFDPAAFWRGQHDSVVLAICVWLAAWPPLHAVMARKLKFSPWRLFGWGMFAVTEPRMFGIGAQGEILTSLRDLTRQSAIGLRLVGGFGVCRVRILQNLAWRAMFREAPEVVGGGLRWARIRNGRIVTQWAIRFRDADDLVLLDVTDEASERAARETIRRRAELCRVPRRMRLAAAGREASV